MKKLIISLTFLLAILANLHHAPTIEIYESKLLPKGYQAMVIYPFVIFQDSKEYMMNKNYHTYTHEYTHVKQVKEQGWLGFYVDYTIQRHTVGYDNISYEREAYASEEGIPHKKPVNKHVHN